MRSQNPVVLLSVVLLLSDALDASAQLANPAPIDFSYQGHLTENGVAATGLYEMRFSLWNAATGGAPVTGVLGPCDVPVAGGLFAESLGFPNASLIWTGEPRWLEIEVRKAGATDPNFTTLSPRQRITSVPYAAAAESAARLRGALPLEQLPPSVARLDLTQTFTRPPIFSSSESTSPPFTVSGTTTRVDDLNVDLLDGRDSTAFWQRNPTDAVAAIIEPPDRPLEIRLMTDVRVLRLERGATSPNTIGGSRYNSIASGLSGATILGGGTQAAANRVEANFGTILGGQGNLIQPGADHAGIFVSELSDIRTGAGNSVIAGGRFHEIQSNSDHSGVFGGFSHKVGSNADYAGIVFGSGHEIGGDAHYAGHFAGSGNVIEPRAVRAVTLGGRNNRVQADATDSVILNGENNVVRSNAHHSVVLGGDGNVAGGNFSLVAGRQAQANHNGAFVWADGVAGRGSFGSQRPHEFAARATGGVRFETEGAGLFVDGQRMSTGAVGTIPDGSVTAGKLADGAALLELLDNDGAGSGLDADLLDGCSKDDFWRVTGNGGTTPGVNFLGTTDNQSLDIRVNNARALRIEPNATGPNIIGGYAGNSVSAGVGGATIAGGGNAGVFGGPDLPNIAGDNFATVGGGVGNTARASSSMIGGGARNNIEAGARFSGIASGLQNFIDSDAEYSIVSGGFSNRIDSLALYSAITGGRQNRIHPEADYAAIGGGSFNQAASDHGAIGGGLLNVIHAFSDLGVIGGGELNLILPHASYSAIVGGRQNLLGTNADYSVIGGGHRNQMDEGADWGVIGGGHENRIEFDANYSAIVGGASNLIRLESSYSLIGGGAQNIIHTNADYATLSGGHGNLIQTNADWATIPGGRDNEATGRYSFAAGRRAKAMHRGSFVLADSTDADFESTAEDQVSIRAAGGVRIAGELTTEVLTITGGADLAEPFRMSGADIPKGAVVVIDENNPGQLKLSDQPYDHRVAGIVSGANGVQPGITLSQQGVIEGGQHVALSGRVYALADASENPIKPGDLLTTSAVPGYAMKATGQSRAQGAILGKAMSSLASGQGMVLVLVSLQ